MANDTKPSATTDQILEVLAKHGAAMESGGASTRKTELMAKSMNGTASSDEAQELTRIMMNETGLGAQVARAFASEALQKSLQNAAGQVLQPAFEAVTASNRQAAEVLATNISELRADLSRYTKPMGQTQVLTSKLLIEQNTLLKSLIEKVEIIGKQPAGPVKGFTGHAPVGAPQVQPIGQPGAPVGTAYAPQAPAGGEEPLSKSVLSEHLMAMYQEASKGATLPNGLSHQHVRDAFIGLDLDQAPHPMIIKTVRGRMSK